jgi:hypothetical protein
MRLIDSAAHLADQDHVRVLAQHAAQRVLERVRVRADLALADHRAQVAVDELDRILDRDDMSGARAVDVIDDRRERRRLAGAGGAGHEDDSARLFRELCDHRRQAELVDAADPVRDRARDERDIAALAEDVDPEARDADDLVGDVELLVALEFRHALGAGEQRLGAGDRVGGLEHRPVIAGERTKLTIDASERHRSHFQMEIGPIAGDERAQDFLDVDHA